MIIVMNKCYVSSGPSSTRPSSMREIVGRCQRGERAAQGLFYRRYRADVMRALYRVLGSDAELEDAVQDAFLEAFRSIRSFKGQSQVTTWLYRVSTNVGLQRLRRQRRRTDRVSIIEVEQPSNDTPQWQLEQRDDARLVYDILATIAPKKRTVFVLHEIFGLTAQEISGIVEANALTVRTRLHYARKEFQEKVLASVTLQGGCPIPPPSAPPLPGGSEFRRGPSPPPSAPPPPLAPPNVGDPSRSGAAAPSMRIC